MRIVDCFTFFDELDMLNLRLHELEHVVDLFVLAEGTRTFSNQTKSLVFEENKRLFERFLPQIRHIVVDDMPMDEHRANAWKREFHQRNALERGLSDLANEDLVMLSDVDELPHPEILQMIREGLIEIDVINFEQRFFYYNLEWVKRGFWYGTTIVNWGMWRSGAIELQARGGATGLQVLRQNRMAVQTLSALNILGRPQPPYGDRRSGGWHFSYFGDAPGIQRKIQSFSHQEFNHDEFTDRDHLTEAIHTGRDLFGRKGEDLISNADFQDLPRSVELIRNPERSLVPESRPVRITEARWPAPPRSRA